MGDTRAHDLGALLGRNLVLAAANQPDKVLAPSRPLADPGRPLPFASQGGIEVLLAQGFGFAAQEVLKRASVLGPVVALQQTAVPVAEHTPGPVIEGPAVTHLQARLSNVVDSLAADALRQAPTPAPVQSGARRGAKTKAARKSAERRTGDGDALDDLIAHARRPRRRGKTQRRRRR